MALWIPTPIKPAKTANAVFDTIHRWHTAGLRQAVAICSRASTAMNGTKNDRVFGLENIQAPLEHFPLAVPFESDSVDVLLISFADHIYRVLFFVATAAGTRQLLLCHVGVKSSASIRGAGVRIILISGANEAAIKMPKPTHVHTTALSDSSVPPSLVSLEIIFKVRHLPYRTPT